MRARAYALGAVLAAASTLPSLAEEGVIVRCGASAGHAYFFKDPASGQDSSFWTDDGMSNGSILLVRLGQEWDIQFGDALGAYGYRQDGATVVLLTSRETHLMVGAFHPNYADIYTFDLVNREVGWTSSKIAPFSKKVAAFNAKCE